jgi:aldose 1-epimerase
MSGESEFAFLPLGAIIQEFRIGGKNLVLGFNTQDQYDKYNSPHFGATIGRVANRIKDAVIHNLNSRDYTLAKNNGPNSLHGGEKGWGKCVFDGPQTVKRDGKDALLFKYLSKDGEEGFPGTVEVRVWYTASKEDSESPSSKTVLTTEYEVEFVGDECEETVVNMTNHR